LANYVTLDGNQTITGKKTFSVANGFNYSGMENGTSNATRPVWFSSYVGGAVVKGTPAVNATTFTYNPSTNVLATGTYTSSTGKINLTDASTIQYNSTDKCIEFVFA
jgi:hypothetical protein